MTRASPTRSFHEVARGLGIKNTVNRKGTVREALREVAGNIEEGKGRCLGALHDHAPAQRGELGEGGLEDCYITFVASVSRSVRIGDHLQADLDRLEEAWIPVDVEFRQGLADLGLNGKRLKRYGNRRMETVRTRLYTRDREHRPAELDIRDIERHASLKAKVAK